MLISILALPIAMLYWFGAVPTAPRVNTDPKPISEKALTVSLNCKTDTVYFYDVTANGIVIKATDLINSFIISPGCDPASFFLYDSLNYAEDSLVYGLNDLFVPPTCIVITAVDNCNDSAQCKVYINILDTLPPVLICPPVDTFCESSLIPAPFTNINQFLAAGGSATDETFLPINIGAAEFSWLGDTTYLNGCGHNVERKYRIEDFFDNADTCSQVFFIQDTVNVRCPSTVAANAITDSCFALVNPAFVIAGNCQIDTSYNNISPNNKFAVGVYDVTYTFISVCGDTLACTIDFNINDIQLPEVACPGDITVNCQAPAPAASLVSFILAGGSVDDNCGLDAMTLQSDDSVNGSCPKTVGRTYLIFDVNGNPGFCTQDIIVIDTTAPTITCIPSFNVNTDPGECYAIVNIPAPVSSDNCGIENVYNTYNSTSVASDTFPLGTTNFIWFAVDSCGHNDTCHVRVVVVDNEDPVADSPIMEEVDCSFSEVDVWNDINDYLSAGGSVSDNCSNVFTIALADENNISPDTLLRIYDVTDEHGNAVEVEHYIVITDAIPPTIIAPADVTISCAQDKDDTMLTGSPIVDDDCNGNLDVDYTDLLISGPCTRVYSRTWTVTDEAGNAATDVQLVTVIDQMAPVFTIRPGALADIDCDDDLPVHQTLAATDFCNPPALITLDTLFNGTVCTGIEITYVWTATDACNNSAQIFESFDVNPDVSDPTLSDPADINTTTDDGLCSAQLNLTTPVATDACSSVNVTRTPPGNTFNKGLTVVTWTATDGCGNSTTVQQNITVVDDEAPELTCKGLRTLDLTYGVNQLPASNFVESAVDNCPGTLTIEARRMDVSCNPSGNVFGNSVIFCCADVNRTIPVVIRVTDAAGNSSTCMTNMEIKDKLAPVVEEPLRDISISCDYFINLNDLSAFGTYVFDNNDRDTIEIDDDLFESLPGDFLDGWINDNCPDGLVLTELAPLDQRVHNLGNIVRRFRVTDASGNSTTRNQTITVIDTDPLTVDDISWPADIEVTDCVNFPPDTSVTGSPIFDYDDICTVPGATYKDQIFDDPTSGCTLIRRKWTVIDWSQYIPNTNTGIWYHTQNIHLINSVAPVFVSSCANRSVCAVNAECDAVVRLGVKGDDDCTDTDDLHYDYKVDLFSNGSIDYSAVADTFEIRMDRGVHTITWRVEDKCGNLTTCSYTVQVKECKAPTPVCMNGLSTNLVNEGVSVIWAVDFNNSSYDNCTPSASLKYSFSSNVNDTGKTLNCSHEGKDVPVSMWVTDLDGNQSRCNTYIKVTDLHNLCPDTLPDNSIPTIDIAGRIATEENDLVAKVELSLNKDNETVKQLTDATGNFMFEDLEMYQNYQVTPFRNDDWLNGLSTLDLVMIQRHILQIKKIESPYKLIAADLNSDAKVTVSDLTELRKLILGVQHGVKSNTSWRFVNKAFVFPNPANPWPFEESAAFLNMDAHHMNTDFIAVKTGDVNGSLQLNANADRSENRSEKELVITINDEYVETDKYVNVPVYASGINDVNGLQLSLDLDKTMLQFEGIMSERLFINRENYHYIESDGVLHIVYFNDGTTPISENEVLFTLQLKATGKFKISDAIKLSLSGLKAEAYNQALEIYPTTLRYNNSMEALTVSQNVPNPFSEQTEVKFFIYDDGLVDVSIYDNNGSRIYHVVRPFKGGMNKIAIGKEELGDAKGVFYLHIATGERKEIKKMIRIN